MLNRRGFLALLGLGTAGALTLDLDKLLWVPGKKTIFLPPTVFYDHETGISMRLLQQFEVTEMFPRVDVLYGWAAKAPELSQGDIFTIEGVYI